LAGALLFSLWQGWSYGIAFYFCFETVATIGLGDYVPTFQSGRRVVTVVYIFFGLAVLSIAVSSAGILLKEFRQPEAKSGRIQEQVSASSTANAV
jgi:hypothetical protein